jgi:ribosome maturation factor RimP
MSIEEAVRDLAEPIVTAHGLALFDVEHHGGVLRVTVERDGGADLDSIAAVTRAVSRALDERDPIAGRYTLEVSSPGLERSLRSPAHFRWAVGKAVNVKTVATYEGDRRLSGVVVDADDDGVVLTLDDSDRQPVRLRYDDIERARTVFEWGGQPKPGSSKSGTPRARGARSGRSDAPNTTRRARAS